MSNKIPVRDILPVFLRRKAKEIGWGVGRLLMVLGLLGLTLLLFAGLGWGFYYITGLAPESQTVPYLLACGQMGALMVVFMLYAFVLPTVLAVAFKRWLCRWLVSNWRAAEHEVRWGCKEKCWR